MIGDRVDIVDALIVLVYYALVLVVLVDAFIKHSSLLEVNVVFTMIWCTSGLLAVGNPLGLIPVSHRTHGLIIISIVAFNSIFIAISHTLEARQKYSIAREEESSFEVNYVLIKIVFLVVLLLMLPQMIIVLRRMISLGKLSLVVSREAYLELTYSGRYFWVFVTVTVPTAACSAFAILSITEISRGKRLIFVLTAVLIIINVIAYGGRQIVLNVLVFVVAFMSLSRGVGYRLKRGLAFLLLITFSLMVGLTVLRGLDGHSVISMFVRYTSGAFSYLEYILNNPGKYGLDSVNTLGYLTFGFIFEPILMVAKALFGVSQKVPSYFINQYTQVFVNISKESVVMFNNNTSYLFPFIRDFGFSGAVLGPTLLALAIAVARYYSKRNSSLLVVWLYMMLYFVSFNSVQYYSLTAVSSSVLLVLLFVFGYREIPYGYSLIRRRV